MKIQTDKLTKWIKGIIILLMVIFVARELKLTEHFETIMDWVKGLGPWSVVVFTGLFVFTAGILLPMPVLMMASGVLYGVVGGIIVISVATFIEGYLLYVIARRFNTKIERSSIMKNKYAFSVQSLLRDGGYKMIALLRCLPYMSYVFLSFVCGVSKINLRSYLLGTWLGMLPVTTAYVYLGFVTNSTFRQTEISAASSGLEKAIMYGGLVAAFAITIYVTNMAKKYLDLKPELEVVKA